MSFDTFVHEYADWVTFGGTLFGVVGAGFGIYNFTIRKLVDRQRNIVLVSIPRQSRGLYVVSCSKRLRGVANAAPTGSAT
jgi:hypothetical protein